MSETMKSEIAKRPVYQANPNLNEVFTDATTSVGFDGANFRVELSVTRASQTSGAKESTVHPAARLVIPLHAVNELMQKLGSALADLEKQGLLRKGPPPGAPTASSRN